MNTYITYGKSNSTWHTQYWGKRNNDIHTEEVCASFVDHNWFEKYPDHFSYERVSVKDRQLHGEDVVLTVNGGQTYIIDEKAKMQGGYVNKVINYPSFEILCKNQYGTSHFESWFVSESQTNTHYAMISVASDKQIAKNEEYKLNEDDITCMVYGLINRDKLHHWVEKETGKTLKEITKDAWDLLTAYKNNPAPNDRYDTVKVYRTDGDGSKYLYLKLSPKRMGQEVNLVVRRDYLRKDHLITEIYVDRNKVVKYTPPKFFDKMGDRLTVIN